MSSGDPNRGTGSAGDQPPKGDHPRGRVLCVTSNFPRWAGDSTTPFVLRQAQDLQDLGWRIDVLAPHAPGAATRERMEGIEVSRFRYLWPETAQSVCYGGGALINLRKRPTTYLKLPALVAAQLAAVLRLVRTGRYDVLYSHWALPQGFVGALVARSTGIPHVVTVHGEEFFALPQPYLAPFKRVALHGADVVTANGSGTLEAARTEGPRIRDLRRIPMGVNTDMRADETRVEEIRERHRVGDGPLVFYVGRLVDEKGVGDLLLATRVLAERCPDVTVLIGGEGQDREDLEKLAAELGLGDRVTFLGFVPDAHQASYYAAADVFVAPSRRGPDGWIEGQGITPLEAMTLGTPVVATTCGGYADSIVHEETALAVPERDPEAIAAAVERIAREPQLADGLRDRGRRLVLEKFSRPAVALRFSAAFEDAVRRGGRPGSRRTSSRGAA